MRCHPMALVREMVRRNLRGLRIVGYQNGIDLDLLVGAGCVRSVACSYVGLESFGLAPNYRRSVERGEVEVIDYPDLMERFYAAALGIPFIPNVDLFGTDTLKRNREMREGISPLTGEKYAAMPGARADITIIHAGLADRYGNVLYKNPRLVSADDDIWFARCSDKVIVTAERIVDYKYVTRNPMLNQIPHYRTTAVVWVPFGAHPCAHDYFYNYDREQITAYIAAAKDSDSFGKYLEKFVYGAKTNADYLDLVGPTERLLKLQGVEAFVL